MEWLKLLVALAVVYLGAHYALKRFYKEKWWEKRLNAFITQIEAAYLLHRALKYRHDDSLYGDKPKNIVGFKKLSEEEVEILDKQYRHSLAELEKFYYLGNLLTSKSSVDLIQNFFDKLNSINPQLLDFDKDALEKSKLWSENLLNDLVNEAKAQLKIDEGQREFWEIPLTKGIS
ncbi:hypothetical protein [Pantoea sp. Fr-CA_6]|uniref:hypothetical protein n=1 Tax=Pantoea sp. Fr-CA_6 TaxID=2929505 RepID=UPI0021177234|nr:hypothetical protein [Pantoea sp. Fr-CA_6]